MKLSKACDQYGAWMGRASHRPVTDQPVRLYLRRVYLDSGGYDNGGAYWGFGRPLYRAWNDDVEIEMYFRADDREDAKDIVRQTYPHATFYR